MNSKREIKKTIKSDFRKNTPDVLNSISIDDYIEKNEQEKSFSSLFITRKFALSFLVIIALGVASLSYFSYFKNQDSDQPIIEENNQSNDIKQYLNLSNRNEIYSVNSFSAVVLLHQGLNSNTLDFENLSHPINTSTLLIEQEIDHLNNYLNMLEPILRGYDNIVFLDEKSSSEDYEFMTKFSGYNVEGEVFSHEIHYNETQLNETDFKMDGIMYIDDISYDIEGEVEIDGDELDLEIIASKKNNEDSYVLISQEIENDEQTFEFELVENNNTIFESSLEIEFDHDEVSVEIEQSSQNKSIEFEIIFSEKSTAFLFIEYDIEKNDHDEDGDIIVEIIRDESTNLTYYQYNIDIDGTKITLIKNRLFD